MEGEPLEPAGSKGKDSITKEINLGSGPPRTGIYEVNQILTWETGAVRRIDHIAIGSMSVDDMALNHRIYSDGTRMLIQDKKDDAGGDPNNPQPAPVPGRGGFGGLGKQPLGVNVTVNGLIKDRYFEVNEQARRLPVGIALIVDQEHMGRILTAFENSKLRFLLNQALVNRYPNSLRPTVAAKDDDPGIPAVPMPMGRPFGRNPLLPQQGPAAAAAGGGGGEENLEANVELVLYGTVTLYQRHPPRSNLGGAPEAPK